MTDEVKTKKVSVVSQVLPEYEKELTPREEATMGSIRYLLNKNEVKDELVRGRIFSKSKAFSNDMFNAGVKQGLFD